MYLWLDKVGEMLKAENSTGMLESVDVEPEVAMLDESEATSGEASPEEGALDESVVEREVEATAK